MRESGRGMGGEAACEGLCTARVQIFRSLSGEQQRQLVRLAGRRRASAGALIFSQGDPADRILVVHAGRIKVCRLSPDGRELVLDILGPGGIYGEQSVFSGGLRQASAFALEEADYCEIRRRDIEELILREPSVGIRMLSELGDKYLRLSRTVELLFIRDAVGRLAGFLLQQAGETGSSALRIARDTLSASLNLRPETVSRKLKELERGGLIRLEGHRGIRILNPEGLRSVAKEAR